MHPTMKFSRMKRLPTVQLEVSLLKYFLPQNLSSYNTHVANPYPKLCNVQFDTAILQSLIDWNLYESKKCIWVALRSVLPPLTLCKWKWGKCLIPIVLVLTFVSFWVLNSQQNLIITLQLHLYLPNLENVYNKHYDSSASGVYPVNFVGNFCLNCVLHLKINLMHWTHIVIQYNACPNFKICKDKVELFTLYSFQVDCSLTTIHNDKDQTQASIEFITRRGKNRASRKKTSRKLAKLMG